MSLGERRLDGKVCEETLGERGPCGEWDPFEGGECFGDDGGDDDGDGLFAAGIRCTKRLGLSVGGSARTRRVSQ